jgi:hypothetical protein
MIKKMFDDITASYIKPGDDQKDPLSFQQAIEMFAPYSLSHWAHHLEIPGRDSQPEGKES